MPAGSTRATATWPYARTVPAAVFRCYCYSVSRHLERLGSGVHHDLVLRPPGIRFDSLSIGRSKGRVPDTITGMAGIAADVIQMPGLRQAEMPGYSPGGVVAQPFALDAPRLVRRLIVAGPGPDGITAGPPNQPRALQVMTRSVNDAPDLLFIFYPESEAASAAGRASLARIAAQSDLGPLVTTEASMAHVQFISSWPGVLHRAKALRMLLLVANGAHDVMLPAFRSFVLSQQASDARLILYPEAGRAFLFQESRMRRAGRDVLDVTGDAIRSRTSRTPPSARPPSRAFR